VAVFSDCGVGFLVALQPRVLCATLAVTQGVHYACNKAFATVDEGRRVHNGTTHDGRTVQIGGYLLCVDNEHFPNEGANANRGGCDVTFVEAMRKVFEILAGKYFRAETTWWTWENMGRRAGIHTGNVR
jgi:hypothetical protein